MLDLQLTEGFIMMAVTDRTSVPADWASASILDARSFRVGNSETVHQLSHVAPNRVRGLCGVVAPVLYSPRAAEWADAYPTCPTCIARAS
jgi:hypothetical protein